MSETHNADLSSVEDESLFDFIRRLVLHLYSGNAPFTPDTAEYKTVIGFANIIDGVLRLLHIKFRLAELLLTLLYNSGIDDRNADLPFSADRKAVNSVCNNKYEETVFESRKAPAVLAVLIVILLILIPLIPVAAVLLLLGAGVNELVYFKKIRGK